MQRKAAASKGIGKAVVCELVMRGYMVYLASRDPGLGAAAKADMRLFN